MAARHQYYDVEPFVHYRHTVKKLQYQDYLETIYIKRKRTKATIDYK